MLRATRLAMLAVIPAVVGITLAATIGAASASTISFNQGIVIVPDDSTGHVNAQIENGATTAQSGTPTVTFQAPQNAVFADNTLTLESEVNDGSPTITGSTTDCVLSNSNLTLTCNTDGAQTFTVPANVGGNFGGLLFVVDITDSNASIGQIYNGSFSMTASGGLSVVSDVQALSYNVTDPPPAITGPASGSTTASTPTITGTGLPNFPLTITDQHRNTICSTTIAANGTYSCTPTSPLPSGSVTLTAAETDPGGSTTSSSADTFTVAVAPTAPAITGPASGSTTTSATPTITGTGQPGDPVTVITGPTSGSTSGSTVPPTPTITGTGQPGDPVTVTDASGNTVCTATIGADGTFSCTPTTALPAGSVTLTATETNPDGSTTAGAPDTFTVVATAGSPLANPAVAGGLGAGLLAFGGIELARRRRRAAGRRAAA
jgi:Bacterial Ig-like domain